MTPWELSHNPELQAELRSAYENGEPTKVLARRYDITPAGLRYWARKAGIKRGRTASGSRLRRRASPWPSSIEALPAGDATEGRSLLWAMLRDKGQPAAARVAAFDKLQASEGWAQTETLLPEPLDPSDLAVRLASLVSALPEALKATVLEALSQPPPRSTLAEPVHSPQPEPPAESPSEAAPTPSATPSTQ